MNATPEPSGLTQRTCDFSLREGGLGLMKTKRFEDVTENKDTVAASEFDHLIKKCFLQNGTSRVVCFLR